MSVENSIASEIAEQKRAAERELKSVLDRIPSEWGKWISTDSGWWEMIKELDENISEIDPNYTVYQVKEKFAGLRYYYSTDEDLSNEDHRRITDLVRAAEEKSFTICEKCGSEGAMVSSTGFWVKTLCESCALNDEREWSWGKGRSPIFPNDSKNL